MKAKLSKLIRTTMLGVALFSPGLSAHAGSASLPQVSINYAGADGSMVGARYSNDYQQYIGCQFINNGGPFVTCGAQTSTGQRFLCYSTQAYMAATVKTITDSSRISFGNTYGASGNWSVCNYLVVNNYSDYLK